MDFRLNDEQLTLQETIGAFCRSRYALSDLAERPAALDRAHWLELAELGVLSVLVPAERDGLGLGAVEAALVFEQLGQHLVPGPLLWSAVAATTVDGVASGELVVSGTVDQGGRCLVAHLTGADLVLALRPHGVFAVADHQLPATRGHDALDPLTPVGSVDALPEGRPLGGAEVAAHLLDLATLLAAAMQVGIAQAALEVAVAYSQEREQFGVPIGSFQALKHLMADMYVRTELARSATYAAAAVIDDPAAGHRGRGVSSAKLLAGEAALENSRAAVQVLGGMGFTWDMPPNFLLKRAWVLEQTGGTGTEHALAVAGSLAAEVA